MFLRHEGFLGAVGAFMNYKLVEEFPNSNSLVGDLTDNGIIECRVHVSSWTVFNIDNHPLLFIINIIMLYLTNVIVGPITNWKECRGEREKEKGKERWCIYVIVLLSFILYFDQQKLMYIYALGKFTTTTLTWFCRSFKSEKEKQILFYQTYIIFLVKLKGNSKVLFFYQYKIYFF